MTIKNSIRAHDVEEDGIEHVYDVTINDLTILTTVTMHPYAVTEWIRAVNDNTVRHIGFEIELDHNISSIGTLQLCEKNRCLVLQLIPRTRCPPSLEQFLADQNNIFIGFDICSKIDQLKKQFPFEGTVRCMDLGHEPNLPQLRREAMETNWAHPVKLSDHQVHYACLDAFLNLQTAMWLASLGHI